MILGTSMAAATSGCNVSVNDTDEGSGGSSSTGSANTTVASTTAASTAASTVASTGSGMMMPDESTSCADAVALESVMNNAGGSFFRGTGVINPAGDSDYFKVDLKKDQWISLITQANDMDDPNKIDTVLSLYNADGSTKLAEVDDAFPRASTDSELFYRVTEDGTYCIKVWEFSDWAGETAEGDPSFTYEVDVLPIDPALYEGYDQDKESNDDPASAQPLANAITSAMTGQLFDRVYGGLDTGTDTDFYSFTAPAGGVVMSTNFTPSGPDGYGATTGPGVINVWEASNTTQPIARLDYAKGADGFSGVPVNAGTKYLLQFSRPNATVGANDFYFVKFATGNGDGQNPQETDDAKNNTAAGADLATAAMSADAMTTLHFLGGTIPAGDTDWWVLPTEFAAGSSVTVVCSSQRAGSGVADMTVTLYNDAAGSSQLETETETDAKDLLWSDAMNGNSSKSSPKLAAKGTPSLKITAGSLISNGATSTHYLCGFHVTTQ